MRALRQKELLAPRYLNIGPFTIKFIHCKITLFQILVLTSFLVLVIQLLQQFINILLIEFYLNNRTPNNSRNKVGWTVFFLNRLSDIIRGTNVRLVNNTVCIFKHKLYESSKQPRTEEVASKHALYVCMTSQKTQQSAL